MIYALRLYRSRYHLLLLTHWIRSLDEERSRVKISRFDEERS
jgi:hypothetical protein